MLNVVAGGGSFLTLPVLIFLGLPATIANATNRVGIVAQNIGAVWGFHAHRVLDRRAIWWAGLPAVGGAVFGAWAALVMDDETFKKVLAFLMVAVTLVTLWSPTPREETPSSRPAPWQAIALAAAFFVIGIYAGFIQAGVGFLVLAATTLIGMDLVRGNAIKVLTILMCSAISLGIFIWYDKVAWGWGLALAAGTVLGGQIGVRLTVLKGHAWVKGVVTVAIVLFAIRLWFSD